MKVHLTDKNEKVVKRNLETCTWPSATFVGRDNEKSSSLKWKIFVSKIKLCWPISNNSQKWNYNRFKTCRCWHFNSFLRIFIHNQTLGSDIKQSAACESWSASAFFLCLCSGLFFVFQCGVLSAASKIPNISIKCTAVAGDINNTYMCLMRNSEP